MENPLFPRFCLKTSVFVANKVLIFSDLRLYRANYTPHPTFGTRRVGQLSSENFLFFLFFIFCKIYTSDGFVCYLYKNFSFYTSSILYIVQNKNFLFLCKRWIITCTSPADTRCGGDTPTGLIVIDYISIHSDLYIDSCL